MSVRKAKIIEVPDIRRFLADREQHGIIPRPLAYLYEHLRDYFVYEWGPRVGAERYRRHVIVGVGALHLCWDGVGEIRSVAVKPEFQSDGVGTLLMEACLQEAVGQGLKQVFLLTLIPGYFQRFGFQEVAREDLPPIAWADCINCIKFPDCDEVPMLLKL